MKHPNVLFLILLISCWVVAASLVAEQTNAGAAVFVNTKNGLSIASEQDGMTVVVALINSHLLSWFFNQCIRCDMRQTTGPEEGEFKIQSAIVSF